MRILNNTYDDFRCAVTIGSKLSGWVRPEKGVHQGDIFSMRLYGIQLNELLVQLKHSPYDAYVGICRQDSVGSSYFRR